MITHKSLFNVGRLGAHRRPSPTTRLGACSCTCRTRGAQALRCYKPPHGGKTTRGRAFVVGIGHPRRELSPGRRYRARRGAIYKVARFVNRRARGGKKKEGVFSSRTKDTRYAKNVAVRPKNVQLTLELRNVKSSELYFRRPRQWNLRPARKWGLIQTGVHTFGYTYLQIRVTRVQRMKECLFLEDGAA